MTVTMSYRFTWVRDALFALDALTSLGLTEEVHAALSWLLRAVRGTAPGAVTPSTPCAVSPRRRANGEITGAPGYRGSGPVREGNSAASQRQLGSYGHLMAAAYHYVRHGGLLGTPTGSLLAQMADKVCDCWRQPDAGTGNSATTALHQFQARLLSGPEPGRHGSPNTATCHRRRAGRWRGTAAEIHPGSMSAVRHHARTPTPCSRTRDVDAAVC